jgi:hypothetical protein
MERTQATLSLLLLTGVTLMAAMPPGVAASTPTVPPAAAPESPTAPALAAADETSCSSCLKCPCGCSPVAGAWTARLSSSKKETAIATFKFLPVNEGCTKFAVNARVTTRSAQMIKCWPEACGLTEFVGTACRDPWNDILFTAIGYGVKRCDPNDRGATDRIVFIAVLTGMIDLPASCLDCNQPPDGVCDEPEELPMVVYVSYYDAEQDQDRDGRPDCDCGEAVLCRCFETKLKRVNPMEPCQELESFVACLKPCAPAPTQATGRAFFRILYQQNKIAFVLTGRGLADMTKATIQVAGMDVVKLADEQDGDCSGLLACACFYPKDCLGPWKGKSFGTVVDALEAGKATVLVCTKTNPTGAISGTIEEP